MDELLGELQRLADDLYREHIRLMLIQSNDKLSDQRIYGRADAMYKLSEKLKEIVRKYKEM
jgi:hypothetical protein